MPSLAKLGLQKRISLLVVAGLTVGLGLFSWLGVRSLNQSTEMILQQRLTIARIMAGRLDETLTHVLLHLQSFAAVSDRLPGREEFLTTANALRLTLAQSDVSILDVILTDENGRVLQVEPHNPGLTGADMSRYQEVGRALATGRPLVSNALTKPPVQSHAILAIAPVSNRNGKVIGVLATSIDVERSGIRTSGQAVPAGNTGYTEIVDGNGLVLSRTEPGLPLKPFEVSDHPVRFAQLIEEGKATVGTCHRCHESGQAAERRSDLLAFAPLSAAPWGVAIRQSQEEALAPARQLESRLFLLGMAVLLVTFALVWMMMHGVVRPIRMLTASARKVAAGDFKAVVPLRRQDEIGQLSSSFFAMTRELASSRDELVSRNEELSALNSIAVTVSQSLELEDVLRNALQKVLEVTRTTTGCVFLGDSSTGKLEMAHCIGLPTDFVCREVASSSASCACHGVLRDGETRLVNGMAQCPALGELLALKVSIACFVCVPLKSRNRTLGIMNIASSGEAGFAGSDFKLLDSIGYHVGLAIENAVLYREAKEKEALRGQLLSQVINAQEEERKRIARELHDEYGQTLTGLIMAIESLEDATPPAQSATREKLSNARSLIVRGLEDIRKLILDLRPSTLDYLGPVAAIRAYAQNHLEAAGIRMDFSSKGLGQRLAPAVEVALFRIVQEAIHNIVKYAGARNVTIHLEAKAGRITAVIADDGGGFDVESVLKSRTERQSLGLLGIEERAILLGGTFNIKSQAGQGTRLTVEIPLVDSPADGSLVRSQPG